MAWTTPEPYTGELGVPDVPSFRRRYLTKTQKYVLNHLKKQGVCIIGTGTRWTSCYGDTVHIFAQADHVLMTSGMVKQAGGNYSRFHFRLTPYGEKCLERGYRDAKFRVKNVRSHDT